jgi:amidase
MEASMAGFPEYESYDALGLADLVRRKELSPVEVVEAAIARIERLNPRLNAVIHPLDDKARAEAARGRPAGPFQGVPFLLKDLLASYAGVPLRSGSRFFGDWRPEHHSELVRRYLASGVIVLGKTNTPELGLLPVTEPRHFGPSVNPWDPTRTPGGSSGGSAAAVAARMVPMASGGDGGGSMRIPASCCGIFGFKPSRGRTPVGPDAAENWQGLAVEHVLTRSVRDSAAMLDATAGPDALAYHHLPPPERPFLDALGDRPTPLRVGWSAEPYLPAGGVDPACRAAVEDAVSLLGELGHECVEARPPLDGQGFARAMLIMLAGETWAEIREAERKVGRRAQGDDFETSTWFLAVLGRTFGAGEYAWATRELKRTGGQIAAFMAERRLDVLLSPTLARPPIPIGSLMPGGLDALAREVIARLSLGRLAIALGVLDRAAEQAFAFMPYTPVFNATGQPSMSVPLHWSPAGLPVGVMLSGRYGEDALLLRLAAQLEEARPWADRRPPVCLG